MRACVRASGTDRCLYLAWKSAKKTGRSANGSVQQPPRAYFLSLRRNAIPDRSSMQLPDTARKRVSKRKREKRIAARPLSLRVADIYGSSERRDFK